MLKFYVDIWHINIQLAVKEEMTYRQQITNILKNWPYVRVSLRDALVQNDYTEAVFT